MAERFIVREGFPVSVHRETLGDFPDMHPATEMLIAREGDILEPIDEAGGVYRLLRPMCNVNVPDTGEDLGSKLVADVGGE